MNLRLFIAVAVPEEIRFKIREMVDLIRPLFRGRGDIRWVAEENWHFTVSFLGSEPESAVPLIKAAMAEIVRPGGFRIDFDRLVYGPFGQRFNDVRRTIWLPGTVETSGLLGKIKQFLDDNLKNKGVRWQEHRGVYFSHLTLARFGGTSLGNLPPIEQKLDWHYEAQGLDLVESHLRPAGAVYDKLFGVDF